MDSSDPKYVDKVVDDIGRRAAPSVGFEWREGAMTVWISPKREDRRSQGNNDHIVLTRMTAIRIDLISSVRKALNEKAKDYKDLGVPLIVAVNAANPFFASEGCELDVLWGNTCVQYGMGASHKTLYVRQSNGFWSTKRSAITAGVMFFRNADILNMFQASATLHISPHYCGPALPSALLRLPHYLDLAGRAVRI